MRLLRPICWIVGHDWNYGKMFSDGWTNTCDRCGLKDVHDR